MKKATKYDSNGLNRVLGSISNSLTGINTTRDKTRHLEISGVTRFTESELDALFRNSGVLRRLVETYPKECIRDWMKLSFVGSEGMPKAIETYLADLANKPGKISVKQAFKNASVLGRQFGDGFVLIGLADGKAPNQPVDLNAIESIEWLKVFDRFSIIPDYDSKDWHIPDYYRVLGARVQEREVQSTLWHHTRVLRFSGNRVYNNNYSTNYGYHDSVIQTVFNSWSAWESSLNYSAAMVADYSQGVYKFDGLGQALAADQRAGNTNNANAIRSRLHTAEMSKSVLKAMLIDKSDEDFEYTHRTYQGVGDIMSRLKDALLSDIDIPDYKIFNNQNSAGSSLGTATSAALIQEYDWLSHKRNWIEDNWLEPYRRILKYAIAAKDSPIEEHTEFVLEPAGDVTMTPLQQIEILRERSEIDQRYAELGVYGVETIQRAMQLKNYSAIDISQNDLLI